ncbi:hypothetical protein HOK51_03240 [Candidatus Woesearchaeota archaeon]|jgi:hypothetical protein|nr:hypothetical protein [Candidatus Woesearchaeota archaeon]MBT6518834.1 hypothetical protein [Candidatus Woesearchaeota archaeon]MBT7367973.1 hypothetical protein [Candidatus Woesearchaeota archaeon]
MLDSFKSGAKNAYERAYNAFRVAPYATSVYLVSFGALVHSVYVENGFHNFLAIGALASLSIINNQFKLKSKLEQRIEESNGFKEDDFKNTPITWCGRQTAYVVAKNAGYEKEFLDFCNKKKDKIPLPNLRNF